MKKIILLLILGICCHKFSNARITLDSTVVTQTVVAQDLDVPWEILWGPDDNIWFTERGGKISRLDPETSTIEVLLEIDDVAEVSESGLLGMVLPIWTIFFHVKDIIFPEKRKRNSHCSYSESFQHKVCEANSMSLSDNCFFSLISMICFCYQIIEIKSSDYATKFFYSFK